MARIVGHRRGSHRLWIHGKYAAGGIGGFAGRSRRGYRGFDVDAGFAAPRIRPPCLSGACGFPRLVGAMVGACEGSSGSSKHRTPSYTGLRQHELNVQTDPRKLARHQ